MVIYKYSMDKDEVVRILLEESAAGKLDAEIIDVLVENYDEIEKYVWDNSIETITRYDAVKTDYANYLRELSPSEREAMEEFTLLPANERN